MRIRGRALDWRMGAEHFEACLIDHTPDANWGNWAYRILPRPCLLRGLWENWLRNDLGNSSNSRRERQDGAVRPGHDGGLSIMRQQDERGLGGSLTTAETVVWPLVHDSFLRHTLAWCWELRAAGSYDLAREPWQLLAPAARLTQLNIRPFKDSGYWFCAANRANWDYEYGWFSGKAFAALGDPASDGAGRRGSGYDEHAPTLSGDGFQYFQPIVRPLSVHERSSPETKLPVKHAWGCRLGEVEQVPPALTAEQGRVAGRAVEHSLRHVLKQGFGLRRGAAPARAAASEGACLPQQN